MNVEWWIFTLNPAHNVMEGMMVLAGPGPLLLGSVGQAERNASPLWIPICWRLASDYKMLGIAGALGTAVLIQILVCSV